MEYHQSQLSKHCRICGERLHSSKAKYKSTVYDVEAYHDQFRLAFGIFVQADSPVIHPTKFCKVCKVAMGRIVECKTKGTPYKSSLIVFTWEGHTDQCKVLLQELHAYIQSV